MNIEKFKKHIKDNNKTDLIFDFDGTIALLDMDWIEWHRGIAKIYKKYNASFEYHGEYLHVKINDFIEEYGDTLRDEIVKFNYEYEKEFTKDLKSNTVLIDFIRNEIGVNMYVLTNNDSRNIKKHLMSLGLIDKFKKIVCRDNVKYVKPNTEGIDKIMGKKKLTSDFLMIGDSLDSDGGVARVADIDFYLIDYF